MGLGLKAIVKSVGNTFPLSMMEFGVLPFEGVPVCLGAKALKWTFFSHKTKQLG